MDSGLLRDLVIIITGSLFLILYILIAVVGFLLYRKVKKLTDSVKDTMKSVKETSNEVKEALKSSRSLVNIITRSRPKEEAKKS